MENGSEKPPRMPLSRHVLDLRKPAQEVREEVQPVGDLVVHDRVAEDVARLGMHQESEPVDPEPEPQAPPPREEEPPPPKKHNGLLGRLFKGMRL